MSPAIGSIGHSISTSSRRSPSTSPRARSMSRSTSASLALLSLIVAVCVATSCTRQTAAPAPATLRPVLQQLRSGFDAHRETLGATEALTTVKHGLRDWVESRLGAAPQNVDTRAFAEALHVALRDGQFLCLDMKGDCATNPPGYVD